MQMKEITSLSKILTMALFQGDDAANEEEQKKQILLAAARIIKDKIKQVNSKREEYPSSASMESSEENLHFLPHSLRLLLSTLL